MHAEKIIKLHILKLLKSINLSQVTVTRLTDSGNFELPDFWGTGRRSSEGRLHGSLDSALWDRSQGLFSSSSCSSEQGYALGKVIVLAEIGM